MRILALVMVFFLLAGGLLGAVLADTDGSSYDEMAYSNCILDNSKNALNMAASAQISYACRLKATPKKCRSLLKYPLDEDLKPARLKCAADCNNEGVWSRKFGDCSLD